MEAVVEALFDCLDEGIDLTLRVSPPGNILVLRIESHQGPRRITHEKRIAYQTLERFRLGADEALALEIHHVKEMLSAAIRGSEE